MSIEVAMTREQIENLATIMDNFSEIDSVDITKEDDGKIYLKILLPGTIIEEAE